MRRETVQQARVPAVCQLVVTSGLQRGASVFVDGSGEYSLGGAGADIRLRDPGVGRARAVLRHTATGLELCHVDGDLALNNTALTPGASMPLAAGSEITLGTVAVSVTAVDEKHDAVPNIGEPPPIAALAGDSLASDSRRVNRRVARSAAVLLVAAAAALVLNQWRSAPTPAEVAAAHLSDVVAEPQFAHLKVSGDEEQGFIDGVLPDAEARAALEQWLETRGLRAVNRVETDATLANKVLDVLRVNAVDAELVSSLSGRVEVATALPAERDLEALQALVYRDVPAVSTLILNNTPPVEALSADPGKRITMVISADPAHIVTVDESRYFINSILPSGHRIESIADNNVTVVRNGQRTVLDF